MYRMIQLLVKKKKKLHNTENECMCALVFIHKY